MYTNTGSLLALSLTSALPLVPSSELIHSLRESDIGAPVDRLPAPVQLSGIYPTSTLALLTCQDIPGFPPQNFALSEYEQKAWGRGYM